MRREDRVRRQHGFSLKGVEHGRGGGVVLRERRKAEDELHGAEHAGGGVECGIDVAAFCVRADHKTRGAVGVDVVGAVLRIVFDDEDRHFRPEFAARGGGDDLGEALVVAGDRGVGGKRAGRGAAGVVFAERHDGEAREDAGFFGGVEIGDPEIDFVHVAHLASIAPLAAVGGGDALGAFAVVFVRNAVSAAEVPEVTVGGRFHLLVAGEFAVFRVADDPRALVEIGGHRGIAPTVAVDADFTVGVEIIEEDVVAGELVVVRRDLFAEDRETRVAVADGFAGGIPQVAEDLVVGAVFLDDVEDVFNRARIADFGRNDAVAGDRCAREPLGSERGVSPDLGSVGDHLRGVGARDGGDGAFKGARNVVERWRLVRGTGVRRRRGEICAGLEAFAIGHEERLVVGTDGHGGRIPADGYEAIDEGDDVAALAGFLGEAVGDIDHHDIVVVRVDYEEGMAVGRHSEGGGRAAFEGLRVERSGDHLARAFPEAAGGAGGFAFGLDFASVNDVDGVVAGAGDEETPVGREGEVVRAEADGEIADATVFREVDDRDGAAAPIGDVEVFAVGPDEAGVRMLAGGNHGLAREGVGMKDPNLVIGLVAHVDATRGGMDRQTG